MSIDPDPVGRIREQWARERPDLDTRALEIVGRLHRLAEVLQDDRCAVVRDAGLSVGEFELLTAMRRSGQPFALTPTALARTTMTASGTVTKRVDRLVAAGWVTRERADQDRRGRRIVLTESGRVLVDEVVGDYFRRQERLLDGFDEGERARLIRLLTDWTKWLDACVEDDRGWQRGP